MFLLTSLTECSTGCTECKLSAQTTPASVKCDSCDTGYNLNAITNLCERTSSLIVIVIIIIIIIIIIT